MKYDKDGKQHKKLLYNELMQDNQTTIKCIINPDPESINNFHTYIPNILSRINHKPLLFFTINFYFTSS